MEGGGYEEAEIDTTIALSLRGHAKPRVEDQLAECRLRVVVEWYPAVGGADGTTCRHLSTEILVRFWHSDLDNRLETDNLK